jgi:pyridoxal phosphate enzyme (YggS family)
MEAGPRSGPLNADSFVAANVAAVRERMANAAARCGRRAEEIVLVAAAKTRSAAEIDAAIAAGIADVGENYVQEAAARKAEVRGSACWHMIGRVQRNKARKAVETFTIIQSVDSLALGAVLARLGEERGEPVRILIEVNLGGEATKGGVVPDQVEELAARLRQLRGLAVEGLMTVPPPGTPESVRPLFRSLRALAEQLRLRELSMGMTGDFETAIEEGSTMVRIGRAIFGERAK